MTKSNFLTFLLRKHDLIFYFYLCLIFISAFVKASLLTSHTYRNILIIQVYNSLKYIKIIQKSHNLLMLGNDTYLTKRSTMGKQNRKFCVSPIILRSNNNDRFCYDILKVNETFFVGAHRDNLNKTKNE